MSRTALVPIRDIFRASFGCVNFTNAAFSHIVSYGVVWLRCKTLYQIQCTTDMYRTLGVSAAFLAGNE